MLFISIFLGILSAANRSALAELCQAQLSIINMQGVFNLKVPDRVAQIKHNSLKNGLELNNLRHWHQAKTRSTCESYQALFGE